MKVTKTAKTANIQLDSFMTMKHEGRKISMITAYDYAMAKCVASSNADLILVGDSLGMVVLGYDNTLQVTIEDMVYHSAAVRRGAPNSFMIIDMPYMSYHLGAKQAKENAAKLLVSGAANAVKLEGGSVSRVDAIKAIVDCEIPVCAHIGLTPQSVFRIGGYKVQGKTAAEHEVLLAEALAVEAAGAFMLVLEGIPELLGKEITELVKIPTVGIGAGRYTDGQVLVCNDLLGYSDMQPKFVKQYAGLNAGIIDAIDRYSCEVKSGEFPTAEYVYYPISKE
ncbi:MAG TPA: 3-methyl-2-oxobutanoate hydroxymethyltransferase [Candidatus Cloacimonadota bacterium]|nr:3-methyl-2-oxobutanoate hydroxymethyltransferase [Candidatus Cloacimonadota bacterium]HPS39164.1 3-methyl-2-oxobutanoate hydroxymethyltransferase [Candidatus Cloacimonadota bacterium]